MSEREALSRVAWLGLLALAACTPADESAPADGSVTLLELGEPVVEIGVLEGPEEYSFGAINSVVRLDGGSFAVADGLSQRISIFDAQGEFVRSWGQKGDGPGEFDNLGGVLSHGPDSLLAAETFEDQLTVFDLEGNLVRTFSAIELSHDSTFRLDSWLHGRYWVQGAITPAERDRTRRVLDRHMPPAEAPGMRMAQVGDDESVWIREPVRGAGAGSTWARVSVDGSPTAVVEVPAGFRPTHFEADRVTGVWRDGNDVSFVRAYRWVDTGAESSLPAWLQGGRTPGEPAPVGPAPPDADAEAEVREEMLMSIRTLAGAQEMHYSSAMSYTDDIAAFDDLDLPEGLHVSFTKGDSRGWTAVFAHDRFDRICGLAYGFDMPLGWIPGAMVCAPADATP